jgi:hypothetical protein
MPGDHRRTDLKPADGDRQHRTDGSDPDQRC